MFTVFCDSSVVLALCQPRPRAESTSMLWNGCSRYAGNSDTPPSMIGVWKIWTTFIRANMGTSLMASTLCQEVGNISAGTTKSRLSMTSCRGLRFTSCLFGGLHNELIAVVSSDRIHTLVSKILPVVVRNQDSRE